MLERRNKAHKKIFIQSTAKVNGPNCVFRWRQRLKVGTINACHG